MNEQMYVILATKSLEPFHNKIPYVKNFYDTIFMTEKRVVSEDRLVWITEEDGKRSLQKKTVQVEKNIHYKKDVAAYRDCIYILQETVYQQISRVFGDRQWTPLDIEYIWNTKVMLLSKWVEVNFSLLEILRDKEDIPIDEIVQKEFFKKYIQPNLVELTKMAKEESLEAWYKWIGFLNQPYFVWDDKYYEDIHKPLYPFFEEEYLKLRNCTDIRVASDNLKWIEFYELIQSEKAKENIMKNVSRHIWDDTFMDTFADALTKLRDCKATDNLLLDTLFSLASTEQRVAQMDRFEKYLTVHLKKLDKDMETLICIYSHYNTILLQEFKTDKNRTILHLAIKHAYKNTMKDEILENFVKFIDLTIRTSVKTSTIDELEKTMYIISCIEDKDIFMEMYQNHMIRRLLSITEKNDTFKEAEEYMLIQFKMHFVSSTVFRLETIYKDLVVKEPLSFSENHHTVRTLNFAACNTDAIISIPTWKIPKQLEDMANTMKTAVGTERVLTWIPAHDSITLETTFHNKKYLLTMTSIQASILFLFDTKETLTKEEIKESLGIVENATLMAILDSLTSRNIPLLQISENNQYQLVKVLNTKKYHVRIPQPPVILRKKELLEKVELNRDYSIDAAIVRIVKIRKEIKYMELQVDVVKQLSSVFIPTVRQIKNRVESLIERDYIERIDSSILTYVA